jgi:internalin A
MHEFFLTARSLYLLVLGERDDMAERDATYWLQLIRSCAGPAPVVVALNKSGGRAREMDRRTLEEKYGPVLAWIPTECSETDSEKSGIEALRAALTEATGGMEEVRRRFPAKWFAIKDWLGGMQDAYIDCETYAARCAELGEPDPAKQEELAAWLHDLGVALNYGRDPRLRDTTVLRPRLAGERHLRHPAGERPTPRQAARAGRGRHAGESRANLPRRGKTGDAEGERLPAGKVAFFTAVDGPLPAQLPP